MFCTGRRGLAGEHCSPGWLRKKVATEKWPVRDQDERVPVSYRQVHLSVLGFQAGRESKWHRTGEDS